MNWLRKWLRFFRPVKGWHVRYVEFQRGRRVWDNPLSADGPPLMPWPLQWIPHVEVDSESSTVGFKIKSIKCVDTHLSAEKNGVCCARCGVGLHPSASRQKSYFDAPVCRRCNFLLFWMPI